MHQARAMWVRFEPIHDVTYFTPESRAQTDGLGCRGGWMGYVGMRAAPLGAVPASTVVSAFYTFHPSLIERALPDAWQIAAPERFLEARLRGADAALRRLLGAVDGSELAEAARLTGEAAGHASLAGRPLAAANAVLAVPEPAHLALWQACTVLRESRGDGHIAALISAELEPCAALVLFAAERGLDAGYLRAKRAWPESAWAAATERLTERGLLDDQGAVTASGRELRNWVEERTDAAAGQPWRELGARATERLGELLTPIAARIAERNEVMYVNPMALDARTELTR
ncbi:SCO6745 family protein [Sciscionella sediminilitoris]|uniref:SCO6745 family protein n=1 Tax=Sciscionella sediminilitoris TaxID=1445613 RepID=UPI0004DF2DDA|nr:hypothetical protein [Sciscionella sp. SE31]